MKLPLPRRQSLKKERKTPERQDSGRELQSLEVEVIMTDSSGFFVLDFHSVSG